MKIGILGATGYTGMELIRILAKHPNAEVVYLTSKNFDSQIISDINPHLYGYSEVILENLDIKKAVSMCDVIFSTLPSGYSFEIANLIQGTQKKLIDLGSDFRFDDFEVYKKWCKVDNEINYELYNRVYGLTELYREEVQKAQIIGNPGCYPTSIILGLIPVLKNKLIDTKNIIIDSKSGISGAGHEPKFANLFSECNENVKPYNVTKHRHIPEIEQELSKYGSETHVIFTPQMVPMTRGILSTMYCQLTNEIDIKDIYGLYSEYYNNDYFIRILKPGLYPTTKNVYGSNFCHIGFELDKKSNMLIIMSVIDNLVKGASGQAVQNMNVMLGLSENKGLDLVPVFP